MLDKELVEKKISQIVEYLDELNPIVKDIPESEVIKDYFKYHTAERLFQLIVDTMLDINIHFIKENNFIVPDDMQSTFIILGDNKALPKDFALRIAPVVGLRNRIVHRYDTLNKKTFIEALKKNFNDFKEYLILIKKTL